MNGQFKKGKVEYKNGNTYVGEVENNKPHGKGTKTWADGRVYEGFWKENKPVGEGYKIFPGENK